MSISVLILTLNEAANLPDCLASVAWADDVVVLDSGSTDGTQAVARAGGARLQEHPFTDFASQRNHGLSQGALRHPWILHLDADERVTPALRDELLALAEDPSPAHAAYYIASQLVFRGRWLRFAGAYPAWQMRFARRDVRFVQVGHGQREAPGTPVGRLRAPLRHHALSKGLADWFERHNRYSTDEARREHEERAPLLGSLAGALTLDGVRRRRALKRVASRLPFRPLLRFAHLAVLRGGLLDGPAGWTYCRMMATYERMIVLKRAELRARDRGIEP
jgi:glycosyltransferase involved in cell wall biosynthesis